jgi:hypothetical protein
MRCLSPINHLFFPLVGLILLGLNGAVMAQVYKSYDANGNIIFSDKPTQGSSEIEVTEPNVSDSFDVPPPAPVEALPESPPEAESEPEPTTQPAIEYDPADTNHDGRVSRREKDERLKERYKKSREAKEAAEGYKE